MLHAEREYKNNKTMTQANILPIHLLRICNQINCDVQIAKKQ